MSIKLAMLKSRENVISDVQEMVLEDRVVGYLFRDPQVVIVRDFHESTDETVEDNPDGFSHTFNINLFPWIPFTDDKQIPVPIDWVVTLVEPKDRLKKVYEDKVLGATTQNDKIDFTVE